jgi:hypothetical protein
MKGNAWHFSQARHTASRMAEPQLSPALPRLSAECYSTRSAIVRLRVAMEQLRMYLMLGFVDRICRGPEWLIDLPGANQERQGTRRVRLPRQGMMYFPVPECPVVHFKVRYVTAPYPDPFHGRSGRLEMHHEQAVPARPSPLPGRLCAHQPLRQLGISTTAG